MGVLESEDAEDFQILVIPLSDRYTNGEIERIGIVLSPYNINIDGPGNNTQFDVEGKWSADEPPELHRVRIYGE